MIDVNRVRAALRRSAVLLIAGGCALLGAVAAGAQGSAARGPSKPPAAAAGANTAAGTAAGMPTTPSDTSSTADVDKVPFATLAKQFPDIRGVGGIFIFNPTTEHLPPSPNSHQLDGMWRLEIGHQTIRPEVGAGPGGWAPYTPAAHQITLHRLREAYVGTPVAETAVYCEPWGIPRELVSPLLTQFLQTPHRIYQVWEEYQDVRVIYMNQKQPRHVAPSYFGHSVGHWDGNTLVVDTIGFNDKTWLDRAGSPHGPRLHIIERIRKLDGGKSLEDSMTVIDPEYYTRPFTERIRYQWRGDWRMGEHNCEEAMRGVIQHGLMVQ